jgi:predicted RNA-binding Zn-ribbon protein involved in translation (DUF1610 family)
MECPKCGKQYPSHHYFVTESLCRTCFSELAIEEQRKVVDDVESLSHEGAVQRSVDGHDLRCPVCGHDLFWKRQTLLNTPGLTLLGVEWANKQADNYVCDRCGHILWFLRETANRP